MVERKACVVCVELNLSSSLPHWKATANPWCAAADQLYTLEWKKKNAWTKTSPAEQSDMHERTPPSYYLYWNWHRNFPQQQHTHTHTHTNVTKVFFSFPPQLQKSLITFRTAATIRSARIVSFQFQEEEMAVADVKSHSIRIVRNLGFNNKKMCM